MPRKCTEMFSKDFQTSSHHFKTVLLLILTLHVFYQNLFWGTFTSFFYCGTCSWSEVTNINNTQKSTFPINCEEWHYKKTKETDSNDFNGYFLVRFPFLIKTSVNRFSKSKNFQQKFPNFPMVLYPNVQISTNMWLPGMLFYFNFHRIDFFTSNLEHKRSYQAPH